MFTFYTIIKRLVVTSRVRSKIVVGRYRIGGTCLTKDTGSNFIGRGLLK